MAITSLDPRTALIIVDLQKGIVDRAGWKPFGQSFKIHASLPMPFALEVFL